MVDPWEFAIELLFGSYSAPVIGWPPEHVHRFVAPPDAEPDMVLEPEAAAPTPLSALETDIVCTLNLEGRMTVREVAAAVGISKTRAALVLRRLRARRELETEHG